MEKPIEPTPQLNAEEWNRVMDDLENCCSADEAKERVFMARRLRAETMASETRKERLAVARRLIDLAANLLVEAHTQTCQWTSTECSKATRESVRALDAAREQIAKEQSNT